MTNDPVPDYLREFLEAATAALGELLEQLRASQGRALAGHDVATVSESSHLTIRDVTVRPDSVTSTARVGTPTVATGKVSIPGDVLGQVLASAHIVGQATPPPIDPSLLSRSGKWLLNHAAGSLVGQAAGAATIAAAAKLMEAAASDDVTAADIARVALAVIDFLAHGRVAEDPAD